MLVRYESLERIAGRARAPSRQPVTRRRRRTGIAVVEPAPRTAAAGSIEVTGTEPVVVELDGFAARTVELATAPVRGRHGEGAAIESDRLRVEAGCQMAR